MLQEENRNCWMQIPTHSGSVLAYELSQRCKTMGKPVEAGGKNKCRDRSGNKDAYFQLVLHPVKAFANLHEMYSFTALNKWYATRKYTEANRYADQVKVLFHGRFTANHNPISPGKQCKWNHMMDQTHIGYTYWQQPPLNKMPGIKYVQDSVTEEPPPKELLKYTTSQELIPKNAEGNIFYEAQWICFYTSGTFYQSYKYYQLYNGK